MSDARRSTLGDLLDDLKTGFVEKTADFKKTADQMKLVLRAYNDGYDTGHHAGYVSGLIVGMLLAVAVVAVVMWLAR